MKRRFNILALSLLAGILMLSCRKEHVTTTTSGTPVFYFRGTVGNTSAYMQAGISNYYMYSSYNQDSSNGVYSYIGNLKEYNCTSTCPPSIEFIINNYKSESFGASEKNMDSALSNKYYNYLVPGGTPTSFSVTFNPTLSSTAVMKSYTWNFGDGIITTVNSSAFASTSHTYNHTGNYNSSLSVVFSDNTTSTLNNPVQMGDTSTILYCSITDSGGVNSFIPNVHGGSGSYSYHWDFGDTVNDTSNLQKPSHIYSDTTANKVSLTVNDLVLNKKANAITYAAALGSTGQKHIFGYTESTPVYKINTSGLSNITVLYTDASGDQYSSNNPKQSDSSFFQITSVSNYQTNENGQSTKQLHIKFDCTVYDASGNSLAIKNGDAVIAVAYK